MDHLRYSIILGILAVSMAGGVAKAEVKRGDPGATCTSSTETVKGEKASCESCTATKCDTTGGQVSNCRKETTKTCTINGRVVTPGGGKFDNVAPRGNTLYRKAN